jgi:hypothetical protein
VDEPDRHALVAGWYRELGGLVTVGDLQSGAAWSPEDVAWALKDVLSILAHVFESATVSETASGAKASPARCHALPVGTSSSTAIDEEEQAHHGAPALMPI